MLRLCIVYILEEKSIQLFDSIPKASITTKLSTKKNVIYKETAALCEIFIMEDLVTIALQTCQNMK